MTAAWACVWLVLCVAVLGTIFRRVVAVTSRDPKVSRTVSVYTSCLGDSNKCQRPVSETRRVIHDGRCCSENITTINEILNCQNERLKSVYGTNSLLIKEHERYRKRRGKMTDVKSDDNSPDEKVTRADDKLEESAGVTTTDIGVSGHLLDTSMYITYHDNSGEKRQEKITVTESQCKKFADSRRRRKKGDGTF